MPGEEERTPKSEIEKEAVLSAVKMFEQVLDSVASVLEGKQDLQVEANALVNAEKILASFFKDAKIKSMSFERRKMRRDDYRSVSLERGEHPGVVARIELEDGKTCYINVYGGMREAQQTDLVDVQWGVEAGHSRDTDEVMVKPTQFNIQVKDNTGNEIFSCWLAFKRGQHVSITSTSYQNTRGRSTVRIEGRYTLNNFPTRKQEELSEPQSDERYAFNYLAKNHLDPMVKKFVSLAPKSLS